MDLLVDIVSRNGNLMLNFPLPNNGMLDDDELKILTEITAWMAVNSEAIYSTRPWKIFGEGPTTAKSATNSRFNERNRKNLTPEDVRFTTKGQTLYAFFMGWPEGEKQIAIAPLATNGKYVIGKIKNVELLGSPGNLLWTQDESGLKVQLPEQKPCNYAYA